MDTKAPWLVTLENQLKTNNMKRSELTNDYVAPILTSVECSVEVGFAGSYIGDDEGNYIPDFEPENNL